MARVSVDHYIPFFGRDFLASTAGWTAEERGHYVTALIVQWEQGSIPDSLERLEIVSPGIGRAWEILEPKFPVCQDGRRRNARMEEHRAKAESLKEARAEAGRIGGRSRQANGKQTASKTQANGQANDLAKIKPPSPSPSSSLREELHTHTQTAIHHFGEPGWAADEWSRFAAAWNRTERAEPWTHLTAPGGWVDLAASPGWLDRAHAAMAMLPGCEFFDTPLPVTRFFEYVDRILAREFRGAKAERGGKRKPVGGNL
jgi:uncharacterized protein YdaU (DUF1376 family)